MTRPIVIAHHLIWTAYGWWLPNDPRGSTSHTIASDVIAELGQLHFGRKTVQPASRQIHHFYEMAKQVLKFELRAFDQREIHQIGEGFQGAIAEHRYTCYACAIMPDHVHIVIRKHKHKAEEMIENLKCKSRSRLSTMGLRPFDHPVWSGGGWKTFLDDPEQVRRTICYIRDNPAKQKMPWQDWPFVKEYDGWPLHPGHSPNSPYVRRLRSWTRKRDC